MKKINFKKITFITFLVSVLFPFIEAVIEFCGQPAYLQNFNGQTVIAIISSGLLGGIAGFHNNTINFLSALLILILCLITIYHNRKTGGQKTSYAIFLILGYMLFKIILFILFSGSSSILKTT